MGTQLTVESVAAVGQRVIGRPVERVDRLPGSVANEDFMLRTGAGDFVLKASGVADLAAEAWACQRVRREGVLAPEVIWLEAAAQSLALPFFVMRGLDGQPATESSPALVVAGEELARVHSIRMHGYGALAVNGDEAAGISTSWAAFLAQRIARLNELTAARVVSDRLAREAARCLEQATTEMHFEGPAALLHGDLKLAHVFVTSDRRVGLIDWGDAAAGDPRFDLARMSMAGPTAFAAVLSGYGLNASPALARSLACYRMVWHIENLAFEHRAGGDWFDHYRSGIASAVSELA